MHKIQCIAVDDEPLALDLLDDNIKRIPFLECVACCGNAFDAMTVLNQSNIDLMFLDIQLPGLTGIDFLKTLKQQPMVIFLTAYKQHALESYEYNALDYLVKPVSFERFLKAVNKAQELFLLKNNPPAELTQTKQADFFMVSSDYSMVKVVFSEVSYIEGLKDYVKIYLSTHTKPIITRMNMKELENILPSQNFYRVHKSYIVNLEKVTAIRKRLLVVNSIEIPVTDMYRSAIGRYFGVDI